MALAEYEELFRFFHILAGIMWIGLLYFFNFVNLPLLKFDLKKPYTVDMAEKATAHISLKALFWFRWGAAFTFLFGLLLIGANMEAISAGDEDAMSYFTAGTFQSWMITMGVILGTIMAFNVWFIIWPNQQKILTNNKKIAGGVDDATKKRLGEENAPLLKNAVFASRTNTWLSVPMLFGMVFGAHGNGDLGGTGEYNGTLVSNLLFVAILALLLALMYFMSTRKTKKA